MRSQYKSKLDRLERGRSNAVVALGHGKDDAGEDIFKTEIGMKTRSELEELEATGRKIIWIDFDTRGL